MGRIVTQSVLLFGDLDGGDGDGRGWLGVFSESVG